MLFIPITNDNYATTAYFVNKRDLSRKNISKFEKCLSQLSFSEIYDANDVNLATRIS